MCRLYALRNAKMFHKAFIHGKFELHVIESWTIARATRCTHAVPSRGILQPTLCGQVMHKSGRDGSCTCVFHGATTKEDTNDLVVDVLTTLKTRNRDLSEQHESHARQQALVSNDVISQYFGSIRFNDEGNQKQMLDEFFILCRGDQPTFSGKVCTQNVACMGKPVAKMFSAA